MDGEKRMVARMLIASCSEEAKAKIMKNAYKLSESNSEYIKKLMSDKGGAS